MTEVSIFGALAGSQPVRKEMTEIRPGVFAEAVDLLPTSAFGAGTREHNVAALVRQAVGAASARVALPALGASREVYVMASQRCFFRTGDSTVVAAAGTSHPLAQDERFYFRVPVGHTHIAVIRDSLDGFITICPVA